MFFPHTLLSGAEQLVTANNSSSTCGVSVSFDWLDAGDLDDLIGRQPGRGVASVRLRSL